MKKKPEKQYRGFAAMHPDRVKEIASLGGKSHSREHLAEIGARGGNKRKENQKKKIEDEKNDKGTAA